MIIVDNLPSGIEAILGQNILETGKFLIDCQQRKLIIPTNPKKKYLESKLKVPSLSSSI